MAFLNRCIWTATGGGTGNLTVGAATQNGYTPSGCANPSVVNGAVYHYFAVNGSQHEEGEGAFNTGTSVLTRAAGSVRNGSSGAGTLVNFSSPPTVFMGGPTSLDMNQPTNFWSYLTIAQINDVVARTGSIDLTTQVNNAIADINSGKVYHLYFPAGRYVTAGALTTITGNCQLSGDGGRAIDSSGSISQIDCSSNTAVLLTFGCRYAEVEELAFVNTNVTTATSTSRAFSITSANAFQCVNIYRCTVDGFYIQADVVVGNSWTISDCFFLNAVNVAIKVQNTVNNDAGDWCIHNNSIYPASGAAAGIYALSSGGGNIDTNTILPNSGTIVDGIKIDFTGVTTQEMRIVNNDVDGCTGHSLNVIKGISYMVITGNYFGVHSTTTSTEIVFLSSCNFSIVGPNVFKPQASTTAIYHLDTSQHTIFPPQDTNGLLGVSFGTSAGAATNDFDMCNFVPAPDLFIGPVTPNAQGLTNIPVDTASTIHGGLFYVNNLVTVGNVEINIGTSSGHISIGIFDVAAHAYIATTGSVVSPGTGQRDIALTASVTLSPGRLYYAYLGADNTTVTFLGSTAGVSNPPSSVNVLSCVTATYPVPGSGARIASSNSAKSFVMCFF